MRFFASFDPPHNHFYLLTSATGYRRDTSKMVRNSTHYPNTRSWGHESNNKDFTRYPAARSWGYELRDVDFDANGISQYSLAHLNYAVEDDHILSNSAEIISPEVTV